jgi:predicted GH43/DUF377 family glycosyl hydrolase
MFKWKKLGRVFNPADVKNRSWMAEYAQSPTAIMFEEFVRIYFSCRPPKDAYGNFVSHLAYVDLNKKDLFHVICVAEEPIIPLGEPGTFDESGTNPSYAIRVNDEIRIYFSGWTRCESVPFNAAIGVAISKDNGQTFCRLGMGPVLSFSVDEPFLLGSPRIKYFNNQWYLWYAAGKKWIEDKGKPEPVYKIRMAYSNDGINWVKYGKDLIDTKLEVDECQASAEVFFLNNRYHMFFSYRASRGYRSSNKGYRIGYACSDDLLNWSRDDSKAGIDVSGEGWDSEMISYPNIFDLNDKVYMIYQGNQFGRFGFGLAVLEN